MKSLFFILFNIYSNLCNQSPTENKQSKDGVIISAKTKAFEEIRLHIWIKAFIPKSHPTNSGYITALPGGKFVIKEPIGDKCAMTDNRTFDSNPLASARLTTEFVLVINNNTVDVVPFGPRQVSRTGESHRVNCSTGVDIETKYASTDDMHIGHPALADGVAQVVVDGRASYPFIVGAPDVNYGGHFTYVVATKKLTVQVSHGVFPAFEAYAQLGNGPVKTIFVSHPGNGTTIMSLIELGTGLQHFSFTKTVQLD